MKWKKGLVIGVVAAAAVAAGVGIAAVNRKDPKTVVIDAFKGVYASDNVYPAEEIFGFGQLMEQFEETGGELGLEISLTGSSDETVFGPLAGSGISIEAKSDAAAGKFREDLGIQYGGMDLANLQIYGDDTYLKAAVPELSSRVFSLNYADGLADQLADSPLVQSSGITLTEEDKQLIDDYVDYMTDLYRSNSGAFDLEGLWNRYTEGSQAINDFKAAMTVTESDSLSFTYNGQESSCTGYDVVLPKDALISFFRTTSEFFLSDETFKNDMSEYMELMERLNEAGLSNTQTGQDTSDPVSSAASLWEEMSRGADEAVDALERALTGDVVLKVYVDRRGNLVSAEGNAGFLVEEDSTLNVAASLRLEGGSYPTENLKASLTLADGTDTVTIDLNKSGEYTDAALNSSWDLTIGSQAASEAFGLSFQSSYSREEGDLSMVITPSSNGESFSITIGGVIDELEKGRNIHYTADSVQIKLADGFSVELAGEAYMRMLSSEVDSPEGTEMDVIAATEDDWTQVGNEIAMNLLSILSSLGAGLS